MIGKRSVRNRVSLTALAALLATGWLQPAGPSTAFAAETDVVYAAAYMGATTAADTTLPDNIDVGGVSTSVNWLIGDDTFSVPYDSVTVTGTAGATSVVAEVEVIPPAENPLIYFIDSGRGGDSYGMAASASPVYEAVNELGGGVLANEVPDQQYVSGTNDWGFDDSVQKVKNSENGSLTDPATDPSIWVVGLRAATTDIVYQLKALEAGTYTLSSGFYDWYGTRSRGIGPKLEYRDTSGGTQTIQLDSFNTNATTFISSEFTIPDDVDASLPMTLTYAYVSGEKPILSWFAVAKGEIKQLIEDAKEAAASTVQVTVDGNDIQADNVNGLTFKGFGVLSGNSSSALLMDYKAEQPEAYAQLLQILFGGEHPIITHVKIEMGNDRNNSTGPDPATMRTADEEANVLRHPGFQLAADAKALNPDLKVSILRWNAPAWADSNDEIYTWYKETILAAYREYGYMVDYVNPGINEHTADLTWTEEYADKVRTDEEDFSSTEEEALYHQIKVVISDEVGIGSFGSSMVNDVTLRDAVAVAGYHYNTDDDSSGNFTRLAEEFDKEIWNSEAQATFSNSAFRPNNNTQDPSVAGTGIGGTGSPLEMGNTVIKGFVNSRRTHFIYQPAIGSFYEGGQYSFKELVSARDPWSGWIHYDAGLVVLEHFSWFSNAGWENETNTSNIWRAIPEASYTGATGTNPVNGRNGTASYLTLAAPDQSDFSTIIINDSEYEQTYKLQAINMNYASNPSLEVWETRAADDGEAFNSNYMQYLGNVDADGSGVYTVHVKPYSIVTVTTLVKHDEASYQTALPVEGERTVLDTDGTGGAPNTDDDMLYADDFDYTGLTVPTIGTGGAITGEQSYIESRGGSKSVIPRYTHDRNGAFEAYLPDGSDNYVLRQQLDQGIMGLGGTWNSGDPVTAIGDYRWTNYKASVDVSFENDSVQSGANYAAIGARYQGGSSSHSIGGTPYVLKFWFDGGWQLLVNNSAVASGNVASGSGGTAIEGFDTAYDAWHNLAIQVAGAQVTAYVDGVKLASYADPSPKLSGRVDLASGYYNVRFDNLLVEKVGGYAPYYSEQLDNLEMNDLASVPKDKLVYGGLWSHSNGQGMYVYQRSLSTSSGMDATLEYTFTGTGIDLLGANDGSAKLDVTVDGQKIAMSAATKSSSELYQTYELRGLSYGEHTVLFQVVSGTLAVDSVAVVSGEVTGVVDSEDLEEALDSALEIEQLDEFDENDWSMFDSVRSLAEDALDDSDSYRLDQEGADQLAALLTDARNRLFTGDIQQLASPLYAATFVGELPNLPEKVEATLGDGSTKLVTVSWQLDGVSFDTAYATVAVSGTYGSLSTVCYVEVVPEDIEYFVDLNATAEGLTSGHTSSNTLGYDSPAYVAVSDLADSSGKQLLNDAPDQIYNGSNGWGHGGQNASGTSTVSYKGIVSGTYSKQSTTGIYTANEVGALVSYTFDNLPAGDHTVTLGTYSWWSSYSRTEQVYLEHDGLSELADTITLDSSSSNAARSYVVSMAEAGTLTVKLTAQNSQSPMLSFVGVAQVVEDEPTIDIDKSVLQGLYDEYYEEDGDSYTDDSWSLFQAALEGALGILEDPDATQEEVDVAVQALRDAIDGLELKDEETDTTKPVIALNGAEVVRVMVGADYEDEGATATDDWDGDITDRIETTVTLNGSVVSGVYTSETGTYVYHYNVSDTAGNQADEATRTVIVYRLSPTPSVDTTTEAATVEPEAPTTVHELEMGDLSAAVGGRIAVQIPEGKDTVLIPGDSSEIIGSNSILLELENRSIELPYGLLEGIREEMSAEETEEVRIRFSSIALLTDEVDRLLNSFSGSGTVKLTAASGAYEFRVEVVKSDGSVLPVNTFVKPLILTFVVDPDANPDWLGVYRIVEGKQPEYVGGTLSDGKISIEVDKMSRYVVLEYEKTFTDVDENSWASEAIKALAARHLIEGVDEARFDPQSSVTRAQFATMLARALNLNNAGVTSFQDVESDAWYANAIAQVSEAGIVRGRTADSFAPDAYVTREEMAVMLARAYEYLHGKNADGTDAAAFRDRDRIKEWAREAVNIVYSLGLINGRGDGFFAPEEQLTRQESAKIIFNLLG